MPTSSKLSYENIQNHCLDTDTVQVEDYLDDNGWVTGERSDILIEEAMTKAQVDAGQQYNGEKNKAVSRFILHPKLSNPIPRTETTLEMKGVQKTETRSSRSLGHIGPWNYGCKHFTDDYGHKKLGVPDLKVRNSDIAKLGTKDERNRDFWQYVQRRAFHYDKTTEKKVAYHSKEMKKKYGGDIKIRHRQADNTSGVSSEKSSMSEAMSTRKPSKPQFSTSQRRKSSETPNASASSSTSSPSDSKEKRNRRAPDYYEFESSV